MPIKFANNGSTTLSTNVTSSATSIPVQDASVFPTISGSEYFYVTIEDLAANVEILKVTAVSGDTLTVVRAQDESTSRAFDSGCKAENRLTAGGLNDVVADGAVTNVVPIIGRAENSDISSVTNRSGSTLLELTSSVSGPFVLGRVGPVTVTQVNSRTGLALTAVLFTTVVARSGTVTLPATFKTLFHTVGRSGYASLDASGTFFAIAGRSTTSLIGL